MRTVASNLPQSVDVLVIVPRYVGLNYYFQLDTFSQYGWNITQAGVTKNVGICPPVGQQTTLKPVEVDILISEINDLSKYSAIAFMPAAGSFNPVPDSFEDILKSPEAIELIKTANREGKVIYTACSGVRVLAAADIINGRKITSPPRWQNEVETAGATFIDKENPCTIDENFVTVVRDLFNNYLNTQGLQTAIENTNNYRTERNPGDSFNSNDFPVDGAIWSKTFGAGSAEGALGICTAVDGGFVTAGYTFSNGEGTSDICLMKTDGNGNKLWMKTFGGNGFEYAYGIDALSDGYIITGSTTSSGHGSKDVYVVRTDLLGNEIWSRTFGGSGVDVGMAVLETPDDNYVISGFTESFGNGRVGKDDIYAIKVDDSGNEIWTKTFGGIESDNGRALIVTTANEYIFIGPTGSTGTGNRDVQMTKTDADGNEIWTKIYGDAKSKRGYGFDWCNDAYPASDGGYVITGLSDRVDIMNAAVVKFDKDGNKVWEKFIGEHWFYDYGNSVCESKDGGFIFTGTTKDANLNNSIYLVKLNSGGNQEWKKTFGLGGNDWGSAVIEAEDGSIVVTGYTDSITRGQYDIFLIKTKSESSN